MASNTQKSNPIIKTNIQYNYNFAASFWHTELKFWEWSSAIDVLSRLPDDSIMLKFDTHWCT